MRASSFFSSRPGLKSIARRYAALPMRLQARILQALLESIVGEHAARMAAMDNATRNSGDLIDRLTLTANRARQGAITTELTEIVSGAEALKG